MTDHRTQLFSLLGDLPPRNYPVTSQIVSSFQRDGVFGERLIPALAYLYSSEE